MTLYQAQQIQERYYHEHPIMRLMDMIHRMLTGKAWIKPRDTSKIKKGGKDAARPELLDAIAGLPNADKMFAAMGYTKGGAVGAEETRPQVERPPEYRMVDGVKFAVIRPDKQDG